MAETHFYDGLTIDGDLDLTTASTNNLERKVQKSTWVYKHSVGVYSGSSDFIMSVFIEILNSENEDAADITSLVTLRSDMLKNITAYGNKIPANGTICFTSGTTITSCYFIDSASVDSTSSEAIVFYGVKVRTVSGTIESITPDATYSLSVATSDIIVEDNVSTVMEIK